MIEARTTTMRAWIRRRLDAGKPFNADDVWRRIKDNWPAMSEDDCEIVFQKCWPEGDRSERWVNWRHTQ